MALLFFSHNALSFSKIKNQKILFFINANNNNNNNNNNSTNNSSTNNKNNTKILKTTYI